MNKSELLTALSEKADLKKKDMEKWLSAFEEVVSEELIKGGKIQIVGFGTWEVAERKARKGTNPQTGKKLKISASKAVKYKPGKALRDAVNK
jgi:DNA-binding protein HU-beta